jgi:hypothetical protein
MKRILILLLSLSLGLFAQAQQPQSHWNKVLSNQPETFRTQLVSSSENSIKVNVQVPGFYTTSVVTPKGEAHVITVPKSLSTAQAGEPDVPMTGIPLMIGDKARMKARVVDAQYQDFEGIEVAPSKGDFSRQIDPATVPYTYGECYGKDAFFPASNLDLYAPYIIRDFRGQNLAVHPFAYNPVSKTLRVYYNMTVELYKVDDKGENIIESRRGNEVKMDPDFQSIYARHFLNYEDNAAKYTVLDEEGDLLIICYNSFMSAMTDFVNWKKTRGINTTIVGTNTAGSTYSAIKNYIQSQYNANNNLTHVLLVGDAAQIPGYPYSDGGSDWSGKGDNQYGQVVGNDIYNDVIIGRFSAGSVAQVTTQVNRILTYERDLTTSATWCQNGLGISASAGSGGHYGEDDYQHVENLRTDLLNYGYSTVYQDYASVSGYPSSSTTTISNHINSGVGIINYCNHGQETGWQSHYYMNSHVNALTNNNKLPFIFSVACLVGKYDYTGGDCFAETWMHATNGSTPTGAISGMFSYISQPWIPPMWAQDEFVDILCELKGNNIKRSFGGAAINSLFSIFDHYSTTQTAAVGTYKAWVLYGDPTLMLRTKTPQNMTVTHAGTVDVTQSNYTVNVSNGNGALATLTNASHTILGKATVNNGTANIALTGTITGGETLTLCVFGYNKVTYLGTVEVVAGEQYAITATADPTDGGTISGIGTFYENTECTLTATPNRGYAFANWTLDGEVVCETPEYTFTVTGEACYTAHFTALSAHSVTGLEVQHGTFTFDLATAYVGETVTLTPLPESGYQLRAWVVTKTDDPTTMVPVSGNQFTMPDYDVTVAALFVVPSGGEVPVGSGNSTNANLPSSTVSQFSLSEQIYTAEELGRSGTITAIAFRNTANPASRSFDIYLKHTSKATFGNNHDWESISASNKVFSGQVEYLESGWFTIFLDTPFEYNGTSNLLVCVDDNTGTALASAEAPKCNVYSSGGTRTLRISGNDLNYNPTTASAAGYNGTRVGQCNQIQFNFYDPDDAATINVFPESMDGFGYEFGEGPSEAQPLTLLASTSDALVVTAPEPYELANVPEGPFSASLTLEDSPVIYTTLYVRLKAGLNGGSYNESLQLQSGSTTQTVSLGGEVHQDEPPVTTVTQTLQLYPGWNWFSCYVEFDEAVIDALKAGIAATNTTALIKNVGSNTMLEGDVWSNNLPFANESMYMILVENATTINLTALPADPAAHPITLVPGWNWIAFLSSEPMSLQTALSGITPNEGDLIKNASQNANYIGEYGWSGSLGTLEPGMGFMYLNTGSTPLTLTFPTPNRKETVPMGKVE